MTTRFVASQRVSGHNFLLKRRKAAGYAEIKKVRSEMKPNKAHTLTANDRMLHALQEVTIE